MAGKRLSSTAASLDTVRLAVGALILVAIVAILGFSYREWADYRHASADTAATNEILESVNTLFSNLIDADAGQRGFLLTGEARYLEPYSRAIQLIPTELANLTRLLSKHHNEADNITQMNRLVGQKLAVLRQSIEVRRAQGSAPAVNAVLIDRGRQVMDEIRGVWTAIRHREWSALNEARLERERASQRALLITIVGSLILVVFVVVGNVTIKRAILAREEAFADAQNARDSLKATIASIGDAVISTDAKGRIVFANKVAQSLLRAPEADILGKHFDDVFRIVNEFSRAKVESPVTKVLREGAVVGLTSHTVLIARDGAEIPIDHSGAPIRGESGPIQGTVLVFRDITERRRAEAAIRLLASIVEESADGIVSKDLNGLVTSWNNGAERIFGYSAGEMIGRTISAMIVPGCVDETPAMLERVKKEERIEQYETVRRAKSGKLVNVSITWSPIHDALGRIVGASKVIRDITERKQAEERFRLAVEAAPNGMVVVDEDGKIILVNSEMERLFGYDREEMIGQPVEFLAPWRLSGEHVGYRRSFFADPRARRMGEGRDLRARRKDGSEFPVEIGLNPIETSHGVWVLSTIVDITERKRIEQQRLELLANERTAASERALRETEVELARVARALTVGEFATSIAHEVNQPLAGVVTNAEAGLRWLGGETPNLQQAKESLTMIVRDGNRASAVIRRIREFLKKEHPDRALLDINEPIQEAVALARSELVKNQIALRVELSTQLPRVRGDRVQLQQVILNLIMNAREAMACVTDRSRELVVTSQKSAAGGVLVTVRDSGVGIEPREMKRMFDAFFTTKPMGMGMGLSISRSIIEAHGGRIWAELNHGPGLTMQFCLPVQSASQQSRAGSEAS